ncbi:MAG TPA: DinB family protein, partial [Gemmatales bacterium]|nr:DinB family protein [Gemmatales bacterium]
TLQQIVHHLADSHIHAYVRFKLTLTETNPTIKPYNETRWSALEEPQTTDIAVSLQLLEALHHRWLRLLENMHDADFSHTYFHPEYKTVVTLGEALGVYAWHSEHHLAQIQLVRQELLGS